MGKSRIHPNNCAQRDHTAEWVISMVPLYDRPLWTLHWENKGLKEFHFLKKQNLESEICYTIDLPLKTKQDKTNTIPIDSWITLVDSMKFLVTGHICMWTTGMVSSVSHQGGDVAPKGSKHGRHLAAAWGVHMLSYLVGLLNASKMKWISSIVSGKRSDSGLLESVQPKLYIRG